MFYFSILRYLALMATIIVLRALHFVSPKRHILQIIPVGVLVVNVKVMTNIPLKKSFTARWC